MCDEGRNFAFVDSVGDGDGVGDEQPDRCGGQDDADQGNQREEADADPLQAAPGTSRAILPNWTECSSRRCASAAAASGYVRSTTGFNCPVNRNRAARSSSP